MSKDIKAEIEYLKSVKAKEVREKIDNARKFCDFNEDATYKDFIDEQYRLEDQIKALEIKLANYSEEEYADYALFNHKIKIKWLADDLEEVYCLVSPIAANVEKNYLSVESPLGKSLANVEVNNIITVDLPFGKEKIAILEIEPIKN